MSKLKELGKHVIGLGMTDSTSALLRDNCDEFIYYEDLVPVVDAQIAIALSPTVSEPRRNVFRMLLDTLAALRRDDRDVLGAALLKNTMCRMHPGFNESQFGYRSFSAFLQDAAKEGLLELTPHQKSGTWVVSRFGDELKEPPIIGVSAVAVLGGVEAEAPKKVTRRRRKPVAKTGE